MINKPTYEIEKPNTPALKWEEYKELITSEWKKLLEDNQDDENKYQEFFERHPCMLPRVYGIFHEGAHGVWPSALISQPVLPTFTRKIPDFMWIAYDSESIYAVLIEIEAPSKPWATEKGQQHHLLTQAIDQIKDWKVYFSNPLNLAQFKEHYKIPNYLLSNHAFLQRYILIYGRRDDVTSNKAFSEKRAFLHGDDEHFMTYDRLSPNKYLSNNICVRIDQFGYKAISIPPTFELNPFEAEDWVIIRDRNKAVQNCKYINIERKNFLIRRWKYWDKWAKEGKKGIITSNSRE